MGRHTNRLLLLAAAFLFSTGGAAIKAASLTSWQVASFRSGVAALAILALVPASRGPFTRRDFAAALAYAATMVLFVAANKLTTSANAIFLQDTAPLYLLLLGPLLLKERLRRADVPLVILLAIGMAMFFHGQEHAAATAPDPVRGNIIAAVSGLAWALTIAGLRWVGKGGRSGMPTVVAGNVIACLLCLPLALPVLHAGWTDGRRDGLPGGLPDRAGLCLPDPRRGARAGFRGLGRTAGRTRPESALGVHGTRGTSRRMGNSRRRAHSRGHARQRLVAQPATERHSPTTERIVAGALPSSRLLTKRKAMRLASRERSMSTRSDSRTSGLGSFTSV